MKNKVCYILLCLFTSFAFMGNVFAEGITITAKADNEQVVKGGETSVTVKITADEAIASCQFVIETESGIEQKSINSMNGWNASMSGTYGILADSNNGGLSTDVPNDLGIFKLNYVVTESGSVTIRTDKCVSTIDEKIYTADPVKITFSVIEPSEDTTLKSLKVIGGEPLTFDPKNEKYGVRLNSSTFGLEMEASNAEYQDKIVVKDIDGNIITDISSIKYNDPTDQGLMQLFITVNDKTTYTLGLSYVQKELDNSLASIKINGSQLALEDGKLEYKLDVDSDVEEVKISVALKDSENFQIGKNSNIEGTEGEFTINDTIDIIIVVEPKSSELGATSKEYVINVTKKQKDVTSGNTTTKPTQKPSVDSEGNVTENQATGDISMFFMALILIASLVGSVILYKKNLESM